ncbi:cAMP-dependent protein kinase subunit [Chamberlinius hualienensis]
MDVHRWNPFIHLNHSNNPKGSRSSTIALMILNQSTSCKESLKSLWDQSVLRVAVDGGANILHSVCKESNCLDQHIPHIISGDFDSVHQHIIQYYKDKGVEVIPTPNQDSTDFTKALVLTVNRLKDSNQSVDAIVTLTSLGERLDHVFGNVNTLFLAEKFSPFPIYLVSDYALTFLLQPGYHVIEIPHESLNVCCGLIPVGEPCCDVTTDGLKWNLKNQRLEFGKLVSTSNTFTKTTVTIQTDKHLLFTVERQLIPAISQTKL